MRDPAFIIFCAMALSFVLVQMNRRAGSPIISIVNRWLRWGIFATGFAYTFTVLEISSYPFWVLTLFFALIWFFGETLYNWIAIKALSESPLPLFPKYIAHDSGEEWPTLPQLLRLRDNIRQEGFVSMQSLRAQLAPNIHLRAAIFQDARAEVRLQITFLPQVNGTLGICMSLSSLTLSGYRYVTDNMHLPFAGFYPENWLLERCPWKRSLQSLLRKHKQRLEKNAEVLTPWTNEPLADINAQQRELEQLNTQLGFLNPYVEREEKGKVTNAGRYRVWKELWMLNYLGRSVRYL